MPDEEGYMADVVGGKVKKWMEIRNMD